MWLLNIELMYYRQNHQAGQGFMLLWRFVLRTFRQRLAALSGL